MNVYLRCSDCLNKQKILTSSFNPPPCASCGSSTMDLKIGSKPEWWTDEDERKHQAEAS